MPRTIQTAVKQTMKSQRGASDPNPYPNPASACSMHGFQIKTVWKAIQKEPVKWTTRRMKTKPLKRKNDRGEDAERGKEQLAELQQKLEMMFRCRQKDQCVDISTDGTGAVECVAGLSKDQAAQEPDTDHSGPERGKIVSLRFPGSKSGQQNHIRSSAR